MSSTLLIAEVLAATAKVAVKELIKAFETQPQPKVIAKQENILPQSVVQSTAVEKERREEQTKSHTTPVPRPYPTKS